MELALGIATAYSFQVEYRVGRVREYVDGGDWLDYGCAEGGYTEALLSAGAITVAGVDVAEDRIAAAREAHPGASFALMSNGLVPYPDQCFDGVFMNEVFEHVSDEQLTLSEVYRVLRPGGHLILMSPNRWFPFEGHCVVIRNRTINPAPLIPWLPKRLTDRWVTARNYWPRELQRKVAASGLSVVEASFVMPTFECHKWLPAGVTSQYQKHVSELERIIGLRKVIAVSNLVVAQRPE